MVYPGIREQMDPSWTQVFLNDSSWNHFRAQLQQSVGFGLESRGTGGKPTQDCDRVNRRYLIAVR